MTIARCNEHGVYEPDERLSLPRRNGADIAYITMADMGTHWIWAVGFQMWSGDWWGSSSPLMNLEPTPFSTCRAASRQGAIELASTSLRRQLSERADEGDRDARAVIAWLDTLMPAQLDLFGAAA